jgi:hypothetical protein
MGPWTRRNFLIAAAAAGLAGGALAIRTRRATACGERQEPTQPVSFSSLRAEGLDGMGERFLGWLRTTGVAQDRAVRNLVWNFFDPTTRRGEWIYPMLSGKAVLWFLQRGLVADATAIARTLLRWQQSDRNGQKIRSYGAFPSKIEQSGSDWKSGDYFYSGDNLVILEALVALYEKTKDPDLINSAIGVGTWLTEVMCKGHRFGVWVEDHGAPMSHVKASGDFANMIRTSEEMLWIAALHRLGKAAGEPAYCRQAERAWQFYLQAQSAPGGFMDNYDPGWPPQRYQAGLWKPYQPGQLIGDNVLRSALGACRWGEMQRARKLHAWLKTEAGAVPAFLNLDTGGSGFPDTQPAYYDVTSSALHRSLCQWLGDQQGARTDIAFLKKVQHESGGWYWGLFRGSLAPVLPQLAPVAGMWATADLSTRVV